VQEDEGRRRKIFTIPIAHPLENTRLEYKTKEWKKENLMNNPISKWRVLVCKEKQHHMTIHDIPIRWH